MSEFLLCLGFDESMSGCLFGPSGKSQDYTGEDIKPEKAREREGIPVLVGIRVVADATGTQASPPATPWLTAASNLSFLSAPRLFSCFALINHPVRRSGGHPSFRRRGVLPAVQSVLTAGGKTLFQAARQRPV